MSDNIATMTDKQLRNEVQLLRDELAIMKRKYEDIIYNLDTENFSSRFVKEQGDMRTAIEVTAKGIETKVSKEEMGAFEESILSQTSSEIKATVKKELDNGDYVTQAELTLTADGLRGRVVDLEAFQTDIEATANGITSRVQDLETFKSSTFIQNTDGFLLDGNKTAITGVIYLTDNNKTVKTSLFHDESQGYEQVLFHSCTTTNVPIIIGDYDSNVYIGNYSDGYEVATRRWVESTIADGVQAVAVFG